MFQYDLDYVPKIDEKLKKFPVSCHEKHVQPKRRFKLVDGY